MRRPNLLFFAVSTLALSGCAVGPNYRAPQPASIGVPDAYYSESGQDAPTDQELAQWWRQFNDPALDALVDTAIANNLDIAQAQARLKQAREALVQANASFLPQIGASASAGKNYRSGTSGFQTDSNGNIIGGQTSNKWTSQYSAGFDASWELDLFGSLARTSEAARADLAASGFDLASVRTAIISELVRNYIQARLAQEP